MLKKHETFPLQSPLSETELAELEELLLGVPPWEAFWKAAYETTWRGSLVALLMSLVFGIGVLASNFYWLLPAFLLCLGFVPLIHSLMEPVAHLRKEHARAHRLAALLPYLTSSEHPHAPALFALAHTHPSNPYAVEHRARLLDLLPQLSDESANYWMKPHRDALHRLLAENEKYVQIAALKGLSKAGDLSTLPFLVSLQTTSYWRESEFRELCTTCETEIIARNKARQFSKILLRAVHERVEDTDLVRPVSTSQEQESDRVELLRSPE